VLLVGTRRDAPPSRAPLRDRGVTDVAVWSRTGRAEAFALKHQIEAVPAHELTAAVASADIVITCTVSPAVVITRDLVADAMARRLAAHAGARALIIDLGLPRNVEAAVAELDHVELLDLETISIHAPLEELQATENARAIVGEAAAEFAARSAERTVEPALIALRGHVFELLEREIARNASRDSAGDIERALRHLAGVLLHTPSVRARELARDGDAAAFVEGVAAVFGIEPATPAAADDDASEAGRETA
jgi:glutamyl-tRNA reductase